MIRAFSVERRASPDVYVLDSTFRLLQIAEYQENFK
jgi:hypothetical protein